MTSPHLPPAELHCGTTHHPFANLVWLQMRAMFYADGDGISLEEVCVCCRPAECAPVS